MVSNLGKRVNAHSWHLGTDQDSVNLICGKGIFLIGYEIPK